ncbi:MAG: uracil-DNA glycosylase [Deltaproteobacteria bacterium]|nr:uracil-DNA glycosylase [Deltaproteobacteria bacterium]
MTEQQEKSIDEELRELADAVREHLLWQRSCGATGIPPGAVVAPEPEVEPVPAPRKPAIAIPQFQAPPPPPPVAAEPKRPQFEVPADLEGRIARLKQLAEEASACTRCVLHKQRKQAVFSRGSASTEVMFVGEGPGADEDAQGEPFVGKAGQLLDKMIVAMGLDREQVYICNVVKCRPPENRTPEPEEIAACLPYLQEQIALINPKVIVALGGTAVKGLLGVQEGITRMRGKWKLYRAAIPVMPTFHPSYLLRKEDAKRDVWTDLKQVMAQIGRPVADKKK